MNEMDTIKIRNLSVQYNIREERKYTLKEV
jgi:hypothetical protein